MNEKPDAMELPRLKLPPPLSAEVIAFLTADGLLRQAEKRLDAKLTQIERLRRIADLIKSVGFGSKAQTLQVLSANMASELVDHDVPKLLQLMEKCQAASDAADLALGA